MSLLEEIKRSDLKLDLGLIEKAYFFAENAHKAQVRKSGDTYFSHCEEVGKILFELNLDSTTIAGGLLHDVLEDTGITIEELKKNFGEQIAGLVFGVTKIGGIKFSSSEEENVENYRKMLLSMSEDLRVILIKLADRLHNMRTLEFLPLEKIERISLETRNVYAPLAYRFGMGRISWELDDLAFKFLEPEEYKKLVLEIGSQEKENIETIEMVKEKLEKKFKEEKVKADIKGRTKHIFSIYRKMKRQGKPISEIYDILAIRIITDEIKDCYHILGIVHSLWTPVLERIKDYIATPKSNLYQSLHTTIVGPQNRLIEIQIRTKKMHRVAEDGIAAHWFYKQGEGEIEKQVGEMETIAWLKRTLEWARDRLDPSEFMSMLSIDLFHEEVFAFTPKGDLKRLPRGSTALDFAFYVHTDVGLHTIGAKVNGRIVPLSYELKNGDIVEILVSKAHPPSRDWFKVVGTSRAKSKLRAYFRDKDREEVSSLGKSILYKEMGRSGIRGEIEELKLQEVVKEFGLESIDELFFRIGKGEISPGRCLRLLLPIEEFLPELTLKKLSSKSGVSVEGVEDVLVDFGKCCQPIPGDEIKGFLTRTRGVVIHRIDCDTFVRMEDDKKVRVKWDGDRGRVYPVRIFVYGEDRGGLLADLTKSISDSGVNIRMARMEGRGGLASGMFVLDLENSMQAERVMEKMKRVSGIERVLRKT